MEKILVLQLNRLGDLVQTLPLLKRLRHEYPIAEITLVCLKGVHVMVAECGYFNHLVTLAEGDVETLDHVERRAAFPHIPPFDQYPEFKVGYDLVINLTSDLGSSILNERIPAKQKWGRIHTFDHELRLKGIWSKYLFAMVSHRLENLFNIVDIQTGMAGLPLQAETPSLPVSAAQHLEAKGLLTTYGKNFFDPSRGRYLVALQTGASQLHRAWGLEKFAELTRNLIATGEVDIVLLGDRNERERAEQLQKMLDSPIIDLVGRTSLTQLPAVLAACDLLVSNDTGTIHIAAAVGTRTLGLFFSTAYFSETAPYGAGHAVLQVEIPCAPCHASSPCPVQICRDFLPVQSVQKTVLWILKANSVLQSPLLPPQSLNLSLYLSQFLQNGSLVYLPVHGPGSKHFLTALLGRLIWEGALGLTPDPVLNQAWQGLRNHAALEELRKALTLSWEEMAEAFAQGLNLSTKLAQEFSKPAPQKPRIQLLHEQLVGLSSVLISSSQKGGLLGEFIKYELMDTDFATYPELASLLLEKYQRLSELTARFKDTMARL